MFHILLLYAFDSWDCSLFLNCDFVKRHYLMWSNRKNLLVSQIECLQIQEYYQRRWKKCIFYSNAQTGNDKRSDKRLKKIKNESEERIHQIPMSYKMWIYFRIEIYCMKTFSLYDLKRNGCSTYAVCNLRLWDTESRTRRRWLFPFFLFIPTFSKCFITWF